MKTIKAAAEDVQLLNPAFGPWVADTVGLMKTKDLSADAVIKRLRAYDLLGALSDNDIMALAFIVMMEAAKSAQEDLRAIMDGVKAINKKKAAQRKRLAKHKAGDPDHTAICKICEELSKQAAAEELRRQVTMNRLGHILTAMSNIMKKAHDTVKNSISNIR